LLGNGLALVKGHLLVHDALERSALDTMIQRTTHSSSATTTGDAQKPILIHRREGKRPLALYVLPAGLSHPATQFLAHACAIILAIDPAAGEPADPALVRDVLGLTLGEARMAALVGSGLPPREAAEKLGIAEETARAVLKKVFSKVGVSRQSELVALLNRMVLS
jgi:DNA-binding CsgD family transcriptional regulator